jgi:hypothetical protein
MKPHVLDVGSNKPMVPMFGSNDMLLPANMSTSTLAIPSPVTPATRLCSVQRQVWIRYLNVTPWDNGWLGGVGHSVGYEL